ncbi:MAG: DUF1326 domain-containing protein [Thermoanaerobaculia bacterium]
MKTKLVLAACAVALAGGAALLAGTGGEAADWAMNTTIIEACSCPMFCQCYFNTEPAEHAHGGGEHFCRFNNAFYVNRGHHGKTDLGGAKFWIAGDLGAEFGDGTMDWAVLHFDPQVSEAQRTGVLAVLPHLYPVEWKSFTVGEDAEMSWQAQGGRAAARLGDGKLAEVVLANSPGMGDKPPVIGNLAYWGAPRNAGFVLMKNEIEAYRGGDKPFEFKGTNGFMITLDINSSDVAAAAAQASAG